MARGRVTDMWGVGHGFWMPKLRVVEARIFDGIAGFEGGGGRIVTTHSGRSIEHGVRPHGGMNGRVLAVMLHKHLGGAVYVEFGDHGWPARNCSTRNRRGSPGSQPANRQVRMVAKQNLAWGISRLMSHQDTHHLSGYKRFSYPGQMRANLLS